MHFIFGGRYMGKLAYARSLKPGAAVCDLAGESFDASFGADIFCNVHLLVRRMVLQGQNPAAFFEDNMAGLQGKIVIGDEVGCGVVPIEPAEREWRDETGRVYQLLAKNACCVTRMWAGIPQVLKRDGKPV
jgi:adenosylcobinamide kinase / adenosylcobinamide-phosphate guanylyltransferase